jgi:hypothetical protein
MCVPFTTLFYSSHSWNSFNRSCLHACAHSICTIFILFHHFPTSSPSHLYQIPQTGPILSYYSPILYKPKKKVITFFLIKIATHVCMYITQFDSSPLFFFFLTYSLSYGSFNQFKISESFLYTEYMNHIHLLNFLLYTLSLICDLPLA